MFGIFLVVGLGFIIRVAMTIIKVPPSMVAVISGRRRQVVDSETGQTKVVGYRTISGGSAIRLPIIERVDYLPLNVVSMPLTFQSSSAGGGEPLAVSAVANVRIGSDDQSLSKAIERLLGKTEAQIHQLVFATLEAHLRSVLSSYSVEQIRANPQETDERLSQEAALVLDPMGIVVDSFSVQRIGGSNTPAHSQDSHAVDRDAAEPSSGAAGPD